MRIAVVERTPVAALLIGGTRIAVGADGVALGTGAASGSLPTVADDVAPPSGERVRNPLVLAGAGGARRGAPRRRPVHRSRVLLAARADGGDAATGCWSTSATRSRPHAKWLALASVLADPSSAGALYVDVRTSRTRRGGLRARLRAARNARRRSRPATRRSGKGESTVAALAAGLAAATPEGREPTSRHEGAQAAEASRASEEGAAGARRELGEAEARRRRRKAKTRARKRAAEKPLARVELYARERRSSGSGRESADLQRSLRDSSPSLTGRDSLHRVAN